MNRKINFECLPQALWGKNIRSELGIQKWDIIRKDVYKKYNHRCFVCNKKVKMNAHEVWKLKINSKQGTGTQILVGIIAVCDECHDTIHIGRYLAITGSLEDKLMYYSDINGITLNEAVEDLKYMDSKLKILNQIQKWDIDLSLLEI